MDQEQDNSGEVEPVCRRDHKKQTLFTCTTEMYGCISLHSVFVLQLLAHIE